MRRRYTPLQSFATFSPAVPHLKADLAVCSGLPLLHRTCRNHVPETRCHSLQAPRPNSHHLPPLHSECRAGISVACRRPCPNAAPVLFTTCRRSSPNAAPAIPWPAAAPLEMPPPHFARPAAVALRMPRRHFRGLPPLLSKCRPGIFQDLPPFLSECRPGIFREPPPPLWWLAPPRPRRRRSWFQMPPPQKKHRAGMRAAPKQNQKKSKSAPNACVDAPKALGPGLLCFLRLGLPGLAGLSGLLLPGLVCWPGLVCMACLACLRWLSLVWPGLPAPRGLLGLPVACSALAALWSCETGLVRPGLVCVACLWPGLVSLVSAPATVAWSALVCVL